MSMDKYTYVGYYFECDGKKSDVDMFYVIGERFWSPMIPPDKIDIYLHNGVTEYNTVLGELEGMDDIPYRCDTVGELFVSVEKSLKEHYNNVKMHYGAVTYYL